MEKFVDLWSRVVEDGSLIEAVFSNVRNKAEISYKQIRVKPVMLKKELHYHLAYVYEKKVMHENLVVGEFLERVGDLGALMKQVNIYAVDCDYQVLISKKMKVTIIEKVASRDGGSVSLAHNRKKDYVFEEGRPVPFLVDLGIMNGRVWFIRAGIISLGRLTGLWR